MATPQMRISEAKHALKICMIAGQPAMIVGAPGIGKSDVVFQVAQSLNYDMILSHPVVNDPLDAKGLPFTFINDLGQQQADFVPYGDLHYAINCTKPTIWFLDDLGQAPPSVQASYMQLLLAREVNGKRISDSITFVSATNGRKDKAGVSGILEPVKSRFALIFELVAHIDDFCSWAYKSNILPTIPAYLRFDTKQLHNFQPSNDFEQSPCPRTWHKLSTVLTQLGTSYPELRTRIAAGAVGEGAALSYCAFERIYGSLPDVNGLIQSPNLFFPPKEPDVLFALCSSIATKTTLANIGNIVQLVSKLPIQFGAMLMQDARSVCPDIELTEAFGEWSESVTHAFIN